MALNGIFILITEHNLEYPQFYAKFYALFDGNLLHAKYVERFFRKAELFLRSTYLPAYLVASFIKKSIRLCLNAPPAMILVVLGMIFNLFKVHPSCIQMIHRENLDTIQTDPFDMDCIDPMKSNAMESSLWELMLLENHYCPVVSRTAKAFSDSLAKPAFELEELLNQNYLTVYFINFSCWKQA